MKQDVALHGRDAVAVDVLVERRRASQFDASIADVFVEVLRLPSKQAPIVDLAIVDLRPAMVLTQDLVSRDGIIMLTADHILNADLILRMTAHERRHDVVWRATVKRASLEVAPPAMNDPGRAVNERPHDRTRDGRESMRVRVAHSRSLRTRQDSPPSPRIR